MYLLALILFALPGPPQTAPAASPAPAFEVAALKRNTADTQSSAEFAGGQVHVRNVPLQTLVREAWNLRPEQIVGAPAWLGSDRYDLAAKADHAAGADEIRVMLQNLLLQRFAMQVHMTQAEHQAYVLTLEPGAESKLGPATAPTPGAIAAQGCRNAVANGMRDITCTGTMDYLSKALPVIAPGYFDHTTVDQTGLTGVYTVELKFTGANSRNPGPSLYDALKQVGLRVQDKKVMLPTLVIDHMDRSPTPN